jgi:hypothetical protein
MQKKKMSPINAKKEAHKPVVNNFYQVLQYWDEGNVQELIDPKLKKPYPVNEIERCIHIALMCLLEQPQMRPKMHDVCHMLTNKQALLPNLPHNCSYWGLVLVDSSTTFEEISLV